MTHDNTAVKDPQELGEKKIKSPSNQINQVILEIKQKNSILINLNKKDEKVAQNQDFKLIFYLIQVYGDPKFKLTGKSTRKGGIKAEFTSAGWVFKNKEDADAIAHRWTDGKRVLKVVNWHNPLLYKVWEGSKEEAKLANKKIKNEINLHQILEKQDKFNLECYSHPQFHPSWLYAIRENVPIDLVNEYDRLKVIQAQILEEVKIHNLKTNDIHREEEDLSESIKKIGHEVVVSGIPKIITDMDSLDKRFAQLEAPGQPCVYINRQDAQPISQNDFRRRVSGEVVLTTNNDGHSKYIDASKFWEGNARKYIYRKIVFTNNKVEMDKYNLFTGFGLEPKKGKCEKILNHIQEVICAGNEKNSNALLKLLSWQIQNIGLPSRIIVILKSKQHQVGKGTLLQDLLLAIYGNAGYMTSELNQILGRFNDTIRGKAFIYLDEALFSGDRKSADSIKSLSTATSVGVETKNMPTVQLPIGLNFYLSTNHDDAAYIEEGDARYWILVVGEHRFGDIGYFNELYEEINNGGREAFMDYLLQQDISDFIPTRDIPKDNVAKNEMIKNSINPLDARNWIEECCHAEMILGLKPLDTKSKLPWELWQKGTEYGNGLLQTAYTEWQKTVKSPVASNPTKVNKFGELLNKLGFKLRIQGNRFRTLPDPIECLKTLTEGN